MQLCLSINYTTHQIVRPHFICKIFCLLLILFLLWIIPSLTHSLINKKIVLPSTRYVWHWLFQRAILGALQNNLYGFSGCEFFRKLVRTKNQQSTNKASIYGGCTLFLWDLASTLFSFINYLSSTSKFSPDSLFSLYLWSRYWFRSRDCNNTPFPSVSTP